jgi:hypothetical protein
MSLALGSRHLEAVSEPLAVAQAMTMLLAGRPADQIAVLLEETLARIGSRVENWDTRAALPWVLVVTERFATVQESLKPMLAQVHRYGSAPSPTHTSTSTPFTSPAMSPSRKAHSPGRTTASSRPRRATSRPPAAA